MILPLLPLQLYDLISDHAALYVIFILYVSACKKTWLIQSSVHGASFASFVVFFLIFYSSWLVLEIKLLTLYLRIWFRKWCKEHEHWTATVAIEEKHKLAFGKESKSGSCFAQKFRRLCSCNIGVRLLSNDIKHPLDPFLFFSLLFWCSDWSYRIGWGCSQILLCCWWNFAIHYANQMHYIIHSSNL